MAAPEMGFPFPPSGDGNSLASKDYREVNPRFRLTTLANALLRHSSTLLPSIPRSAAYPSQPRICLWDNAAGWSEIDPTSWTVFAPYEIEPYLVLRRATWLRSADFDTFTHKHSKADVTSSDSTPTFELYDSIIAAKDYLAVVESLTSFVVPIVTLNGRSLDVDDADSYGFEYYSDDQPAARVSLQWSDGYPASWDPVITALHAARSTLESYVIRGGHPPIGG